MKLYRFTGRKELFRYCGLLPIDPLVSGNETKLRQAANKLMQTWKDEDNPYHVQIEQIELVDLTKDVMIDLMQSQDTEILVTKKITLKEWKYERSTAD